MPRNSCEIDGLTFAWLPSEAKGPASLGVYWRRGDAPEERVEIGRLSKWRLGAGWIVLPRVGGRDRACDAGMGLSRTRAGGVMCLVRLARSEATLTPYDKLRFRILREEGETIRDLSAGLTPIPASAA
jgi:hypothetical protein